MRSKAKRVPEFRPEGKTMILSPHPDDETFGCGGLVSRLCNQGNPPLVVILTGGEGSLRGHGNIPDGEVSAQRRALTRSAASRLGLPAENLLFLDFCDGNISARPALEMQRLRQATKEWQPSHILYPHHAEGWPDHLAVNETGRMLAAECGAQGWEYCVWAWYYSTLGFDWNNARVMHLSSSELRAKRLAAHAYLSAVSPCSVPWVGSLPKAFVKACTTNVELFFKE